MNSTTALSMMESIAYNLQSPICIGESANKITLDEQLTPTTSFQNLLENELYYCRLAHAVDKDKTYAFIFLTGSIPNYHVKKN